MPTTSPAPSIATAKIDRRTLKRQWSRSLIALALLIAGVAFFFGAGVTSQRANGANTGPGAGAVSNTLFGGCVVCVLALIVLGVATLVQRVRARR